MMKISKNKRFKVLSIPLIVYIIVILIIITKVQVAKGYEISIYDVYPTYFWLLIISVLLICIFYCLHILFYKNFFDKSFILIPIFTIIFTTILLILLPLIRNYAIFDRSDALSHIGLMKDILNTGHINNNNWYPILHIFGSQFSILTSINIETVTMIFPSIFYLCYISSFFLLAFELLGKKIGLIIFLISLIPLFGPFTTSFYPHTLGLFLLPFMMYIFLKSIKDKRYSFLYIIIILPFIIFHPLRGLFFIAIIIIIFLIVILYENHSDNKNKKFSIFSLQNKFSEESNLKQSQRIFLPLKRKQHHLWWRNRFNSFRKYITWLRLILLTSIIWLTWYILYDINNRAINEIKRFIFQFFKSNYQVYGDIVQKLSPPLTYVLKVGIFTLGIFGIMIILGVIFILASKNKDSRNRLENKMQTTLMIFLFSFFNVITILFFFIGSPGGYVRYFPYAIIFSTFLVGSLFCLINIDKKSLIKKYHIREFIYFLLAIIIVISVLGFYESPLRGTDNQQVTRMELVGMKWTFEYRNDNLNIEELQGTSQYRFYSAIYGNIENAKNIRFKQNEIITPHFGYGFNSTLGNQYKADAYLIISKISRIRYQMLYPNWELAQFFTNEDFKKLELDKTVNNIYSNSEFNTYYINAR